MEQFVLIPASAYNKSLITQSVTKQELPKYQLSQNPTYRNASLKKEMNKKFFSKADSLVHKILSCPRIKLSNSKTLILDDVETKIFLSDFAQQLRRKNEDVPHIYFILLYATGISPTLILKKNAKTDERRNWSLSKPERQKLQRLYTQSGAAYGSVRNLVKTSKLSVSKVRQILHSKPSSTKFTLATREFKRVKSFARFKSEICCMDLACVDKLAKNNKGVKYLLVRQDLFDRFVDAKRMKTKDSKKTVCTVLIMITRKKSPQTIWVDKGTEFAGECKNLCKAQRTQLYSTMSETKAAFAERTIRSLKNILYPYMEDNGYQYIHKLTQFFTTLISTRNCSIDLIPKNVKNSDILSLLYSKPLREVRKPQFKIGDRVRISNYDLLFRKDYKPQFTKEVLEIVAISSRKPSTYAIKD